MIWRPKFVRSLGWDPGYHDEVRNSPENKIHIREVKIPSFRKFGIFLEESGKVPMGPTCGPMYLEEESGPWGCCLAYWARRTKPTWALPPDGGRGNPRVSLGGKLPPSPLAAASLSPCRRP